MTAEPIPNDLPIIPLPGYEAWAGAYEWGDAINDRFPGQDGDEFAYACAHNDAGPANARHITNLVMRQQGENDVRDWVWHVTFADGTNWAATGGCDFTGWDCMSDLSWEQLADNSTQLEVIARGVAALPCPVSTIVSEVTGDRDGLCPTCDATLESDSLPVEPHDNGCVWVLARAWVDDHPVGGKPA